MHDANNQRWNILLYVAYNEGVVLLLQTELCNLQRNGEQKKKSIINQIMLTVIVSV